MKHFAATLLIALSLSTAASAFSFDMAMPNLTFPQTDTTVSSQSCVPTATLPCK